MFDFLKDMENYEDRKLARWPESPKEWIVDTCRISDSQHPFETAIQHKNYNDGKMIIVEEYDGQEAAQIGHDKWVEIMSAEKLPDRLVDVSTCGMARLCDFVAGNGFRQSPKM